MSAIYLIGGRTAGRCIMRRTIIPYDEKRLLSLVESVRDWIWEVDTDGIYTYSNPAVEDLLGYTPEEVIGKTPFDFMPPEESKRVSAEFKRVLKEKKHFERLENLNMTKDGRTVVMETSGSPIIDDHGRLCGYRGVDRDITERKNHEEELKFRNLLLSNQQEAAIDGILVVDEKDSIVSFNRRFVEMWGIPSDIVEAKSGELALQSVLHKLEDPEQFVQRINYLYAHRTEKSREEVLLNDGRMLDRYSAPMIGEDGKYYGRVWYYRDITDRKNMERQQADFYAMMTHDIKSPLTSVMGYSELILKDRSDDLDEDLRYMVGAIHNASVKLYHVVDDILSLSRLESGRLAVNPVPSNVKQLLSEVCGDMEHVFRDKGLAFETDIPDELPTVVVDPKLLQRAVTNLLQNAANYTPAGGSITISANTVESEDGTAVSVTVADTGCGIPVEERHKVFEKYYRSRTTCDVKGTGLGLAIVKAVAEAHKGRVELESEVGRGSAFRLILPVAPGNAA